MEDQEWVTIQALLKKGEYPVIMDLLKGGQAIENAIFYLQKFKNQVDKAVAEHTGVKIERRQIERRAN